MKNFSRKLLVVFVCCVGFCLTRATERAYDIRDYGAVAGGEALCTGAIQKAVDKCAADGGGTVCLPAGVWLSGTIQLRSHVTLKLEAGCRLLGSPNPSDYTAWVPTLRSYTDNYTRQSLIRGEGLEHVTICGQGTIDGNGTKFFWEEFKDRPFVIRLVNCRDVLVEGVSLCDSPMWMQHYLACERVRIHGIAVNNHVSYCNDGIDIDGCRDVMISDCRFDTDDDALCLKSTCERPCENVTINNCVLSSHCNALKLGTESNARFRNITIANCAISSPVATKALSGTDRGLAGLALEVVDGATLDRVVISNLAMDGVATPIVLRLGDRARPIHEDMPKPGVGAFRNVLLSDIVATRASKLGCSIIGLPGHPIDRVGAGG